ncbi:head decoration protein [Cupriavidus pauculus]|uniref:head decoration protein n=1 Tax=Cupriavidus pauculus TaxID=82633 RepID=UPI001EE1D935|nr:head decoration protein [Cupriavidus pauculus]GJG92842.1 head decoration protein [Cupriavidus pauculus]
MSLSVSTIGDNPQQPGITAQAYVPDQLIAGPLQIVTDSVTITGGPFKRGTVLGKITASGKYTQALSASSDGSQTPVAILADDADGSAADVISGVYLMAEVNGAALFLGTGITLAAAKTALRAVGIFVKTSVTAADPT